MTFRKSRWTFRTAAAILLVLAFSCLPISCRRAPDSPNATAVERAGATVISGDRAAGMPKAEGRTVYVPVYSHIYHADGRTFDLTSTLSIRNTDSRNSIVISGISYYDTAGKLVREYAPSPVLLPRMATLEYVVGERDRTGGSGANFIVKWFAETAVAEPVIECVMIGTNGQQGISFVSAGTPLKSPPEQAQ
jgi:hypothetical protein